MPPRVSRRLLPALMAAGVGVLVGVAGVAYATTGPTSEPITTLARPANDVSGHRNAKAPVTGTVPGLTGAAAEQAAGDAATRFRSMAADRGRVLARSGSASTLADSGSASTLADSGSASTLADEYLHTAWGTAFSQSNGKGLRATHSVFTGTAAATHGGDVVYAPTALPSGGACMEMTTAYTSGGPVLWAWMWCGGNDTIGKLVNIDASFLSTYTATVNGQAAYTTEIRQTNASNNTWTAYLYNYSTHAWDVFFTKSGSYDLGATNFGWDMFEIYSTRDPATNTAWYCSSMAGKKFEASSIAITLDGTNFSTATSANSYSYGNPPPAGSEFDCPNLTFTMVQANNNWVAQIGGGSSASPSPSVVPSSSKASASASAATSSRPASSSPGSVTGACAATYTVVGQWSGGFQGEVRVTAGSSAINRWTVSWTYANGQTISQAWGATVTSSGSSVTATNAAYNGSVAAGASTTFGFIGTWTGSNGVPTLTCAAS